MLIKRGSAGALVRSVQARVGAMITGVWNTATYRKVYDYQKANKLNPTGEVDDETHDHMFPPKVKPKAKPKAVAPKPAPKKIPPKSTQIEKNETN
tara:strand:- start:546 stop:830 length:285 start_codon:yes stop_codon:yes gene_type:complete